MKKKVISVGILLVVVMAILTGCVPGDGTYTYTSPAGFFWGIWHGWIAPISLVWGFFDNKIRIYETLNTGWKYDFGFYIAIISGFGGLRLFRKKRSDRDNN